MVTKKRKEIVILFILFYQFKLLFIGKCVFINWIIFFSNGILKKCPETLVSKTVIYFIKLVWDQNKKNKKQLVWPWPKWLENLINCHWYLLTGLYVVDSPHLNVLSNLNYSFIAFNFFHDPFLFFVDTSFMTH
jgi:hypothetical protein